jgi:hypothetical protein
MVGVILAPGCFDSLIFLYCGAIIIIVNLFTIERISYLEQVDQLGSPTNLVARQEQVK